MIRGHGRIHLHDDVRRKTGIFADLDSTGIAVISLPKKDEGHIPEQAHIDRLRLVNTVHTVARITRAEAAAAQMRIGHKGGGHSQDQFLRAKLQRGDAIRLDLVDLKGKVDFFLEDLTGQFVVAQFLPADMNVGVFALKLPDDPREHIGTEKARAAKHHTAVEPLGALAEMLPHVGVQPQDLLCRGDIIFSFRRQRDRRCGSVKNGDIIIALHFLHHGAERRLRDEQPFSRLGKALFLIDGVDIPHFLEHLSLPPRCYLLT